MREKQAVINSNNRNLYGMVHLPEKTGSRFPAVVMFHGFTGTSVEPHRLFVKIGRKLAESGVAAVRFDFSGAGQSEGNSEDVSFIDWADDAQKIYEFTAGLENVDRNEISGLGISMGGAVLMYLLAGTSLKIKKNCFLSPAAALPELITIIQKDKPVAGGCMIFNGNRISLKAMEIASKIDLFSYEYKGTGPCLIIHSRDDRVVPAEVSEKLNFFFSAAGISTKLIMPGSGGHTFDTAESEDLVLQKTAEWFSPEEIFKAADGDK